MQSTSPSAGSLRPLAFAGGLLTFTLIVAILYFARAVAVPIALAGMLAFVLNPVVLLLHRWGFSRVPAVISTVVLSGVLIGCLLWMVGLQLGALVNDLPHYERNVRSKIATLREAEKSSALSRMRTRFEDMVRDGSDTGRRAAPLPQAAPVESPRSEASDGVFAGLLAPLQDLSPAFEALGKFLFALVLAVFMLARREDLRNRLVSFAGNGSLTTTTRALDDAGRRISRYMITQLIINGSFALAVGFGLFLIGVPYALLWGLCAGILRYIPYVGPFLAAAAPLATSFMASSGWIGMLLVLGLFVILELITANVIEPWLYGQGTGVSEVALLVSAAFWAWLWGPVGLMLATPLTVCLVVAGKYVPSLAFFDKLLGDRPAMSLYAVYLQRLLARDSLEAASVIRDYRARHAPETVYDSLFVPALTLARHDRVSGAMTAADVDYVVAETTALVKDLAPPACDRNGPVAARTHIIALPARDDAEELSLLMLEQLVSPSGIAVEVCSTHTLPSEMISQVGRQAPALVFIAALPPGGLPQASYLCGQLRERWPDLGMIVGYWGCDTNLDEIIVSLRAAGANYVTTTLLGARSHILSMLGVDSPPLPVAEPPLPAAEPPLPAAEEEASGTLVHSQ